MRKINLDNTMCESLYRYDYEIISTRQFATREECATQTPGGRSSETDCCRTAFFCARSTTLLVYKKIINKNEIRRDAHIAIGKTSVKGKMFGVIKERVFCQTTYTRVKCRSVVIMNET